jgi:hypothetical protein
LRTAPRPAEAGRGPDPRRDGTPRPSGRLHAVAAAQAGARAPQPFRVLPPAADRRCAVSGRLSDELIFMCCQGVLWQEIRCATDLRAGASGAFLHAAVAVHECAPGCRWSCRGLTDDGLPGSASSWVIFGVNLSSGACFRDPRLGDVDVPGVGSGCQVPGLRGSGSSGRGRRRQAATGGL